MEGRVGEVSGRHAFDAGKLGMILGAVVGAGLLSWTGFAGLVGGWTVGGIAGAEVGPLLSAGRRGERPTVRGRAARLAGSLAVGSAVLLTTSAYQFSDFRVLAAAFVLASVVALWLLLDCRRPTTAVRIVVPAWGSVLLVGLFVSFLATGLGASVGAGPGNGSPDIAAQGIDGESTGSGPMTTSNATSADEQPEMVANESEEYAEETVDTPDDEYRPGAAGAQPARPDTTETPTDAPYPGTGGLPAPLRDPGVLAVLGVVAVLVGTIPRFRRG